MPSHHLDRLRDLDSAAGVAVRAKCETRSAERSRSIDRGGSALPGASHPPKFETPLTPFFQLQPLVSPQLKHL